MRRRGGGYCRFGSVVVGCGPNDVPMDTGPVGRIRELR